MNIFNVSNFFDISSFEHKENLFMEIESIWEGLERLKDYLELKKFHGIHSTIQEGVYLENSDQIYIGKNTYIEPGVYIKGPVIIGDNNQIRHGAYIRGNVITGKGCIIGHSTEVKNSIFLNNAVAAHFAYVGDSIIGNGVNLGAGVKIANFRLDKKKPSFLFNGKKIYPNLNKLGAIIGDNVQIGCNTVINPATFIGKNSICYSCLNIGGLIDSNSIIKSNKTIVIKKRAFR